VIHLNAFEMFLTRPIYTVQSISFRTDFFFNSRTRAIYRPAH